MPLDGWLPAHDVRKRHERRVDASPEALELALNALAPPPLLAPRWSVLGAHPSSLDCALHMTCGEA